MKHLALIFLRLGLGITFLWIGILIFQNPLAWGGYIQPWAIKLLPVSIEQAMLATSFLDMAIGVLLLTNIVTWLSASLGALHLLIVLLTAGINAVTVRDIGLFGTCIALALYRWPYK